MSDPISKELSKHLPSVRRLKIRRYAIKILTDTRFTIFLIIFNSFCVCLNIYSFIYDCLNGSPGWAIYHLIFAVVFMKLLHRNVRNYRLING